MKRPAVVLTLLLFLVPAVLKLIVSAGVNDYGTDGWYYTGIASHVEQGEGLTTRVSLFHHGYRSFPHPSPVYPLWPLLLGYVARLTGLHVAAVWLPTLLYFTSVFLAWLWARKLPRSPLVASWPEGPDTAHAAAALIAWNILFFSKTSVPYTEGLGMTLLFACLWRSHTLWPRRGVRAGVEMGLWIGVIFLTRSQLVLVAMAAVCAFAWALLALPDRRRTLAMLLPCAAIAGALMSVQYFRLSAITVDPATSLLRFEMAQANTLLAPVHVLTDTRGPLDTVVDRLRGLPVAFSPTHELAYMRGFFGLQYALLLSLPLLVAAVWRAPASWIAWLRDPGRLPLVFFLLLAAGGLVSMHLVHKDFGTEWHFGRRHALTAWFAFFLCWLFLASSGRRRLRAAALVLLAVSLAGGASQMVRLAARSALQTRVPPSREEVIAFLAAERSPSGGPISVAMSGGETQRFGLLTGDAVNYHWLHLGSDLATLETLVREFGVRYLLVRHDEREPHWAFLSPRDEFDARFERLADLDDFAVYRPRESLSLHTVSP